MNILSIKNLTKHYGIGDTLVKAIDGISLDIKYGEFVAIVGSSGSGKSTLLNLLGGLDVATSGDILIGQTNLALLSKEEQTIFRRKNIGIVFQNYNLIQLLNVYENIILPIQLDGLKPDEAYINEIMDILKIEDKKHAMPNQLSGGQQQRVALARALASKPEIILADEPTGNLDSKTSHDVLGLIKISSKQYNQTVIMITHNDEMAQLADRILRLEDGRIQDGDAYEKE